MEPTGTSAPPDCDCHGQEMGWHKDARHGRNGWWECRVKYRERFRRRYAAMDSIGYNALLLANRRSKALTRRKKREATRG